MSAAPVSGPTGADALVAALVAAGVERVFGLPGVHNLALWSSLRSSSIVLHGVRHEQAAVYAADGQARITGVPGVAITTTGPGAANTLGATGEAWASHAPLVVIATDISTRLRRPGAYRGVLHETPDQGAMFAPVVKEVIRVGRVEDLPVLMRRALRIAAAAPAGPVYLEVPTDLLSEPCAPRPHDPVSIESQAVGPDPDAVARAAALLGSARRPLLWVGRGAVLADAGPALAELAARIGAPVLETYGARGIVSPDHPSWVGLPPHVPEAGDLWDAADVVVAVGTDFDGMMTQNWAMPQPASLIAINTSDEDANKAYVPDVTLLADARLAVRALVDALGEQLMPVAGPELPELRERALTRLAAEDPEAFELLGTLEQVLDPDVAVFADMCIPGYWTAGFHPFAGPRRLAYPVGWGTLGYAFPASIGGALGSGRPTLCITGDGGFMFAPGELATIAQERPPLTVLVVDDGGYGMLRYDQRVAGTETFGVDLATPDFVAMARSFGLAAEAVSDLGPALRDALSRGLSSPEPTVIVASAALNPPPTTSPRWYRNR